VGQETAVRNPRSTPRAATIQAPQARLRRAHLLVLGAAVVASLTPFLAKPFHIDDPMYLWTARHIVQDPVHFYDFEVNWYGRFEPMYAVNKNPPLVGFYLAGVGSLFGWSERALHAGMMLPALAVVLGTYALARRLCADPLLAALAAWTTPVLLVSATTLMCDVLMLALWVWGAALWLDGLERDSRPALVGAAILAGLAPLAKYFGLALVPLLFAYTWTRRGRLGRWVALFGIPLAIVGGYQLFMRLDYGWDPLADVAAYALGTEARRAYTVPELVVVGLGFLGGCLATVAFFAPLIWSLRTLLTAAVATLLAAYALVRVGHLGPLSLTEAGSPRWDLALQIALFAAAGIHVLALAVRDLAARRSPEALLLGAWLAGVWVFASFTNWTTTARAVLPAAPAAAILLARELARVRRGRPIAWSHVAVPLAAGLALALAVARADQALASSARVAAETLAARQTGASGRLYFQGAWGFQHYMEAAGATRLDLANLRLQVGDRVITPGMNTNLISLPGRWIETIDRLDVPAGSGVTTLSLERGAGFYAALYGPLPYSFGPVPAQSYTVVRVLRPLALRQ